MIRINLLPVKEIKAEVGRRRDLTGAGVVLGLTALLLVGLHFYQSYRLTKLDAELVSLRKEIQALNVKVKEVGDLQNKIKELKGKYQVIDDLGKKKVGPVRVMESLASAAPPSLWLTEFKETNGSIVMNGLATDNQTVADFLKTLAKFPYFKDVELVETTQADEKTGPYKKFSIKSAVSYQAQAVDGAKKTEQGAGTDKGRKG
jgi:type IV pilus assembly protein PilN